MVFFFAGELKLRCQSAMMGFAAGVMLAASVWSMIIPAMERADAAGMHPAWLPAAITEAHAKGLHVTAISRRGCGHCRRLPMAMTRSRTSTG